MIGRKTSPNMSNVFLSNHKPAKFKPYVVKFGVAGSGLWDSAIAPALSSAGSFISKASDFIKPLASAAAPVFGAIMSIKAAANQAEQLRLLRELAVKNYDARIAAEKSSKLTNEQKDVISRIVKDTPAVIVPGSGFRKF